MLNLLEPARAPRINPIAPAQGGRSDMLQRDRLYARLAERPLTGITAHEVELHFRTMPARYWQRVTKAELIWGLETVHGFLANVAAAESNGGTVAASARSYPERGLTKVMICSHDRPGLLAKIAAAFGALRVSILRADVYTRADGVALDLFEICDLDEGRVFDAERVRQLVFVLEGALSEPPRFVSLWASLAHKSIPFVGDRRLQVEFDHQHSALESVIRVQTADRPGLLHDLLEALTNSGLNITEARVETDEQLATDLFYVTTLEGRKLTEAKQMEQTRQALIKAVSL